MANDARSPKPQGKQPAGRRPSLAARIGVSLLSILITLGLVEAGLRVYILNLTPEARQSRRPELLQDIPGSDRVYGLRPMVGPPAGSNSFGFRGPEVSQQKGPGTFRILMLGDSITYGNSVDWNQTFAYFLQQRLTGSEPDVHVEVLNLGVSGYNSRQELATLRDLGLRFSPDLIVLNICLNDSDPVKHLYGLALKNETRFTRWSDLNIRTVVDWSYLLTLVKHRLIWLVDAYGGNLKLLNSPKLFLDTRVRETAWQDMKAAIREMHQVAVGAGIPMAAVIYPYRSQVGLSSEDRIPQQDLLAFLGGLGVPALDATPAYQDAPERMFVDGFIHLSPYGHSRIADALRAFLAGNGLLPFVEAPRNDVGSGVAKSPVGGPPSR